MNLKIKRFFNLLYYTQNFQKNIDDNIKFLIESDLLLNNKNLVINYDNNLPPLYYFSSNSINIPNNFYKNTNNYNQLLSIQNFFSSKSLEFIIKHEVGHLNHHQFLSLELNNFQQKFDYVVLNSQSNYIKTHTSLDKLFDRTLSNNNSIEDFIHMNFTESYADAYAGLTSYLNDNNLDIFENITKYRTNTMNQFKKYTFFNPKINQNNSSILEILSGKFSTSRYSNIFVSDHIKKHIIQNFQITDLNVITIDNLHSLLQLEVLKSLNKTLKNEINENPLFNNDFKKYLLNKNFSIQQYFNQFEQGIKEYQDKTILNIIQSDFINKNQSLLSKFIDFHAQHKQFQTYVFISPLLTITNESKIHSLISELVNNGHQINHPNFSKYIFQNYILTKNELSSFFDYLSSNHKTHAKFNSIINSLKPTLLNSLIKYNNTLVSHSIPTLNNYSHTDVIDLITQDLSSKNKKLFIDYINKNNIKDITTPYLSSSNANVTNEEKKQFQYEPKSAILSRIINITNQDKSHHEKSNSKKLKI